MPRSECTFSCTGNRWRLENISGGQYFLEKAAQNHSIYIFRCTDCVITIPNKVNNITLDQCSNVSLYFVSVISSCELIRCERVQLWCKASMQTLQVDMSQGVDVFLSRQATTGGHIITSSSSDIYLYMPIGRAQALERHVVPASMFLDQFATHFARGQDIKTCNIKSITDYQGMPCLDTLVEARNLTS